jgi:hypothetical protein
MHGKDRTLIASLGFSDPDKGELHDRACFFCTTESFAAAIPINSAGEGEFSIREHTAQLEHPIKEGYGIVGFADVLVNFDLTSVWLCPECNSYRDTYEQKKFKVLIEVKTRVEPVGNWVRQINLYRAKMPVDLAILACVQVIPDMHQAYLRQANIIPITFKGMRKDAKLNRKLPTCECRLREAKRLADLARRIGSPTPPPKKVPRINVDNTLSEDDVPF